MANGEGPAHLGHVFSDSFLIPAGERCDFDYRIGFTLRFHEIVYGDLDDPRSHHLARDRFRLAYESGRRATQLTEDRTIGHIDVKNGVGKLTGIILEAAHAGGKTVFTQMGQIIFTFEGEELKRTAAHEPPDVAPIVCGLLGGNAA